MNTIRFFSLVCLLFTFCSCNYFKSEHPQAALPGQGGTTGMTDKSILNYSATIDRTLSHYKKEYSLIYLSGDLSVYAEKYSAYGDGKLYKTYSANGNISNSVKSYYFKNDSLILVKEQDKIMNEGVEVYKNIRTYLRNNVTFKMDSRTAGSAAALSTLPYLLVQPSDNKYPAEDYTDDIKSMDDAIAGKDKFEMVFDNITTYPDAHYIFLKSKNPSNYKASLLVNTRDAFIDSLLNFPSVFKDDKLSLKWKIKDKEAVYVPVDSTSTSASGLNK
ncbi:hypothetical protein OQY15_19140 [Pedobacter sp. MC2016-15]|uniref:hypothetical protein n=1 Tax=Pedobacter sp. MC2016-15 TaxID=2994473 RepID=UPI00224597F3|nr:hypothetical protein [Pedobacter sp. MC2016-15]MCX2481228.1 hypothetical protein [Pedobacter sp. MC2016-15]